MANEITVRVSLTISKDYLEYNKSRVFRADQNAIGGPTPGTVLISTNGTDLSLTPLDRPGLCVIQNLDEANTVLFGRYDPSNTRFYPAIALKPGECFVIRLSDLWAEEEFSGTGTGTDATVTTIRLKALNDPCLVTVEAFED